MNCSRSPYLFTFLAGETFGRRILLKARNAAGEKTDYQAQTGSSIIVCAKKRKGQESYDLYREITLDTMSSYFDFEFSTTETGALAPGEYVFEIKLVYNGNTVAKTQHSILVERSIT